MKLEKYFLLLALGVFAFALQSCDDDDNDRSGARGTEKCVGQGASQCPAYRMGKKRYILCG